MSRIYWDTMLFVYMLEDNPEFSARVQSIHRRITERQDTICTSVLTIGEVMTGPLRDGDAGLATRIRDAFRNPCYEIAPFTLDASDRYAQIRGSNRVKPADAIHLATAAQMKVNLFLTNDRRLSKLMIPGIDFIAGLDVNLF
jgi:predicted nucleic acid-binding protein